MSLFFLSTGSLKSLCLSNVGAVLTLPKECTFLGNRVLFLIKKMSNSVSVTTNQKQIGLLNYGVGNAPLDLIYMWVIEIHQFQTESLIFNLFFFYSTICIFDSDILSTYLWEYTATSIQKTTTDVLIYYDIKLWLVKRLFFLVCNVTFYSMLTIKMFYLIIISLIFNQIGFNSN